MCGEGWKALLQFKRHQHVLFWAVLVGCWEADAAKMWLCLIPWKHIHIFVISQAVFPCYPWQEGLLEVIIVIYLANGCCVWRRWLWVKTFLNKLLFSHSGFFVLLVAQKKLAGLAACQIKSVWVAVSLRDSRSLGKGLARIKLLTYISNAKALAVQPKLCKLVTFFTSQWKYL